MDATVKTVRASDAEAVEMLLGRSFLTRLEPVGERCALTIADVQVGSLSLGRATFDMVADLRGDDQGVVGIGRARAGRLSYAHGDDERRWGRGDLFVAVEPFAEYALHVDGADVDHTMIDVDVFAQIAERPSDGGLRLEASAPVSEGAAAAWMRTWDLATGIAGTVGDGSSAVPDLVAGHLARLLAAVTLATFPSNVPTATTFGDRRDARPAVVRRAAALAEAHPDLDLTLADLARAARVSTRALQLAFRRHLDTTPMAFLRRVRLDRAHAELLAAAPGDGTTVTAVAARWGWARPSRFTASYHAAYGRLPSEDLAGPTSPRGT